MAHRRPARPACARRSRAWRSSRPTNTPQAPTRPAPTYPVYRFSWLRDGAFIADAMSRAGRPDSADAFFGWCARVARRTGPSASPTWSRGRRAASTCPTPNCCRPATRSTARTTPTRGGTSSSTGTAPGSGPWPRTPAATVGPVDPYLAAVRSTVDYLDAFGDRPCFDWWEEHAEHRHTSTLAAISGGLRAAAELLPDLAGRRGRVAPGGRGRRRHPHRRSPRRTPDEVARRRPRSTAVCLAWADRVPHGDARIAAGRGDLRGDRPAAAGRRGLPVPRRHVLRRRRVAHPHRLARLVRAAHRPPGAGPGAGCEWIADQATVDDLLPEQVSASAQDPSFIEEWTHRWGPVATPLLWSHAMYLTLGRRVSESGARDGDATVRSAASTPTGYDLDQRVPPRPLRG